MKRYIYLIIILTLLFAQFDESNTAKAQSDKVTFAVIGDYGLAGQPLLDVSTLIKSWAPDFIVTTGDNNYPDGAAFTIDANIGQYFHEYIYKYNGKYGNGSPTRRFYPSLGNHDWTTGAKPYFDFFGYSNPVTYYDFIQGPVHFFVLDSDRNEPDGVNFDSVQGKWLKKTMSVSTSPFNIVVFHHSPYSSGRHGPTEYMRWPFKEWGADAVLTGHDHIYERLLVNGIPYFVNGIGGAELYNIQNVAPESQLRFNQDFGAMRVEANSLSMKFQMFSRTGGLVDEYSIGASKPSVSSITRLGVNPTRSESVDFQVNFSESVSGVDSADFTLNTSLAGAAIANVSGAGTSYIVTVNTGAGDGTLRLDLTDNDSILSSLSIPLGWQGLGNGNFSAGESYSIDKTAPAIASILRNSPSPSNAATVDFAVTFNESVTGVDGSDFVLSTSNGATISFVTGAGTSYLVSVATGNGNDVLRLDFTDNDSVFDSAGNPTLSGFLSAETYTIDRSAPVITAITSSGQLNGSSVEYIVSFSEPVSGVDGGDFFLSSMNGAGITNVTGAETQFVITVAVQPGSDSIRLDGFDNDSVLDALGNPLGGLGAGNGNFLGGIVNIAIDTPIATSILRASPSPTRSGSVDYIVTFSEFVEGVDASDFTITNGSIVSMQNLSPFFMVSISVGASDGELRLDLIDDDSIHNPQGIPLGGNGAGNGNRAGDVYSIDRTPPQVTSIIRAGSNPSINATADFIVTFSEPVLGVEQNDFQVTGLNVIKSVVIGIQNSNPFYWLQVQTGAGSGSIRLDMLDNGNITDLAGNALINNSYVMGESYTLAKTPVDFSAPSIKPYPNGLTNNPLFPPSWSALWNAQAYEVFIARDNNFSQLASSYTTTETFAALPSPLPDGAYFMRVRAYDSNLNPGKFSKTYAFMVDSTPPPPPNLRAPANNSQVPRRPNLTWRISPGAISYQIEVDNNADFTSPEFSGTTTKVSLQIKTLLARQYYWRVRAKDPAGNWSAWSVVYFMNVK